MKQTEILLLIADPLNFFPAKKCVHPPEAADSIETVSWGFASTGYPATHPGDFYSESYPYKKDSIQHTYQVQYVLPWKRKQ